jgi:hypothetical protein
MISQRRYLQNRKGVETTLDQTCVCNQIVETSTGDLGCSCGGVLERLVVGEIALDEVDVAPVPRRNLGFSIGYVADEADGDVVGVTGDVIEEGETNSSRGSGDEVGRHDQGRGKIAKA